MDMIVSYLFSPLKERQLRFLSMKVKETESDHCAVSAARIKVNKRGRG